MGRSGEVSSLRLSHWQAPGVYFRRSHRCARRFFFISEVSRRRQTPLPTSNGARGVSKASCLALTSHARTYRTTRPAVCTMAGQVTATLQGFVHVDLFLLRCEALLTASSHLLVLRRKHAQVCFKGVDKEISPPTQPRRRITRWCNLSTQRRPRNRLEYSASQACPPPVPPPCIVFFTVRFSGLIQPTKKPVCPAICDIHQPSPLPSPPTGVLKHSATETRLRANPDAIANHLSIPWRNMREHHSTRVLSVHGREKLG